MPSGILALSYASILFGASGFAAYQLIKAEVNEFFSFMKEVNDK